MRDARRRLGDLLESLTPLEATRLHLKAFKEGKKPDRKAGEKMTPKELVQLGEHLTLVSSVNAALSIYIPLLLGRVEHLRLTLAWLLTLDRWGQHAGVVADYIAFHTKKVITASNYARLLREAGRKGTKARASRLQYFASHYEVFPDAEEREVRAGQLLRSQVQNTFRTTPLYWNSDTPSLAATLDEEGEEEGLSSCGELARLLAANLKEDIQSTWNELRSVELVLEEVAGEFGGEDPAHPDHRRSLVDSGNRVKGMHKRLEALAGPFDLIEPTADDVAEARVAIERAG